MTSSDSRSYRVLAKKDVERGLLGEMQMKVRPRPPQLCPSLASDFFWGVGGGEGRGRSRILSTKAAAVASVGGSWGWFSRI